uniref:Ricin B lectin domain-containing protein n=1 Tax=Tetradesmus obliquus TaxID=3088 RepID=A0A383W891_TETOB|eukprot:jgi/Sobl393_1/17775/SZX72896.1
MLTALAPELGLRLPEVLTDVVTSNFGRIRNLAVASRGPFRLCGKVGQLLAKVTCTTRLQQPSDALPWSGCVPAVGTVCTARCPSPTMGPGYKAVCTLIDNTATWQVTGGCPPVNGRIVLQADPALCVTPPALDDDWQIKLQGSNKTCIGVGGGGRQNRVQVVVYRCDGTANQRWVRDPVGALRPLHALGSCMDIPDSNFQAGTRVQLFDCNKSKAQLFSADFMPYIEAGVVQPKADTSLCIAAPELGLGKPASLQPCNSNNLHFIYSTDGSLRVEDTEYCLKVHGYRAENNAAVGVWECTGQNPQRWWKDPDGALHPLHAFAYCLDVPFSNFRRGTALQIFGCNQTPAQQFVADIMPQWPAPAYLGCFRDKGSSSGRSAMTSQRLAASPSTLLQHSTNFSLLLLPLLQLIPLYQLVLPGGPIHRGCVTDEKAFIKGLPAEVSLNNVDGLLIGYNTAKAFALMNGAKYFALARTDTGGYGYIFDAEPTTAPMLNVTVNGSSGCYSPCADDASTRLDVQSVRQCRWL